MKRQCNLNPTDNVDFIQFLLPSRESEINVAICQFGPNAGHLKLLIAYTDLCCYVELFARHVQQWAVDLIISPKLTPRCSLEVSINMEMSPTRQLSGSRLLVGTNNEAECEPTMTN